MESDDPLAGNSSIKSAEELCHPRKGLINIQNVDANECFKWSLLRYLHPADHHPARITNADKGFAKKFDFKDIKFPVKVRDKNKMERKNPIGISVFSFENKENNPIYMKKIMFIYY